MWSTTFQRKKKGSSPRREESLITSGIGKKVFFHRCAEEKKEGWGEGGAGIKRKNSSTNLRKGKASNLREGGALHPSGGFGK